MGVEFLMSEINGGDDGDEDDDDDDDHDDDDDDGKTKTYGWMHGRKNRKNDGKIARKKSGCRSTKRSTSLLLVYVQARAEARLGDEVAFVPRQAGNLYGRCT